MTATMTSSVFALNTNSVNHSIKATALWQADIYDFDNDSTSIEIEARDEDEAYSLALDAASSLGIDANYILVYRF